MVEEMGENKTDDCSTYSIGHTEQSGLPGGGGERMHPKRNVRR